MLAASLNSTMVDFIARTKILSNHASWYILEQLPVIPPDRFQSTRCGAKTATKIVCEAVLELTYTSHDIADFARDLCQVDEAGPVLPPFNSDDDRRWMMH